MAQRYGHFILALGLAALTGSAALAQSTFGCTNLAGRQNMPALEGIDGFFFRLDPDLRMFHSISEESIAQLARFSAALAQTGTQLVYVPVPTRALAMPDRLPNLARDYGYETDLAATVYDDTIRRLTRAGVLTLNARRALRLSDPDKPPFFATDPRLTPEGAERMAQAIAEALSRTDGFDAAPRAQFSTRTDAPKTWPSTMRSKLQRRCMLKLPQVTAPQVVTVKTQAADPGGDTSVFADRRQSPRVTVVGDDITGAPVSNLAGFLSQATGFDVAQYSVADGGSFAAISSYLTSSAFRQSRPAYLVWANPIAHNLARYGDRPLRELTTAANGSCRVSVPFVSGRTANVLRADLRGFSLRPSQSLYVDADGAAASEARFDFVSQQGLVRSEYVLRHPGQVKTGRFYMPMNGIWREGVQSVDITLDVAFGPETRVSICVE